MKREKHNGQVEHQVRVMDGVRLRRGVRLHRGVGRFMELLCLLDSAAFGLPQWMLLNGNAHSRLIATYNLF